MNTALDIRAAHAAYEAGIRTVVDELYRLIFVERESITDALETTHRFMPNQFEDFAEQMRAIAQDHDKPDYLKALPF